MYNKSSLSFSTVVQTALMASSAVIKRFDIINSHIDKRKFRGLLLKNQLRVLLISDATTDKSGAAVGVGVGHMSDPWELPGIAHFCEHMLFLGTEKYPDENHYSKFIASNGGRCNASTWPDHTRFYFDINPKHLKEALHIFAQFFICPQFTESATEREVNAVDSENKNNIKNDLRRLYQLEKAMSDQSHDYSKFGTGNKQTLVDDAIAKNLDTRKALLDFHRTFYSANIMSLCIIGSEDLDDLEKYIIDVGFDKIVDKNVERPSWKTHHLGPSQCQQRIEVVPVKELHLLQIRFPMPDTRQNFLTKSDYYLCHLIGHEGIGSLYAALKKLAWILRLTCDITFPAPGLATFEVDIELSEEGIVHADEVVFYLFSYIGMLKRGGPQSSVWDELAQINSTLFTYKDKEEPMYFAADLSRRILDYPMEHILDAPFAYTQYTPSIIEDLMKHLTPENCIFFLVDKKFSAVNGLKKEKWYGIEYRNERFTEDFCKRCNAALLTANAGLFLPPRNEYIPSDFALRTVDKSEVELPTLACNNEWYRLWHFFDASYNLPKCTAYFWISSPAAYKTPMDNALERLMADCFVNVMAVKVYDASLAGLHYSISAKSYGIELKIHGFNEKLLQFVDLLFTSLLDLVPGKQVFEVQRERLQRLLKNFYSEQPYSQGNYYLLLVLKEKRWTKEEVLQAVSAISYDDLLKYIHRYFSCCFIEALIHGNVERTVAKNIMELLAASIKAKRLNCTSVSDKESLRIREYQLKNGTISILKRSQKTHPNSALITLLQAGKRSNRANILLGLVCQLLQEPSFDILRTKEQLGYIVFTSPRRRCGAQGIRIIVQGLNDPTFVIERVENFLAHMRVVIEKMSAEEFTSNVESLAIKRLEKPKRLRYLSDRYWREVLDRTYQFDRDIKEVEILRTFTKSDVLEFYDRVVSSNACERKVLHICVKSELHVSCPSKDNAQKKQSNDTKMVASNVMKEIDNLNVFKMDLTLYDLDKSTLSVDDPASFIS
ncbi:hypothetical protein AB6A40_002404 [Gnathostoma spinigerum]|uniref:Insulin-degrading enzyme n=1 Tax=Gnathostoma spinigerum TaxID=75299 RepID=A0ABD6E6G7_9BILA